MTISLAIRYSPFDICVADAYVNVELLSGGKINAAYGTATLQSSQILSRLNL